MNYTNEQLNQCPVHFDELAHTYTTAEGKLLSGITPIIERYITPDKYSDVPDCVLEAAAERGHRIHSQIQMIVEGFPIACPMPEVDDFFNKMVGTEFIASEYLVSDLTRFASAIDIIDSELNLYDIKTTAKLDTDYLRWQLSIYAYLFERQNPELKVNELRAVWLREAKCKHVVKVERVPDELIIDLLNAAADGQPWSNPFVNTTAIENHTEELAKLAKIDATITEMEQALKVAKEKRETLVDGLKPIFKAANVKTFDTGRVKYTYIPESEAVVLDGARLKAEKPEIWEAYSKKQKRKDSMRITIKEQ